jgi:Na+/H+ antiporter NhaA
VSYLTELPSIIIAIFYRSQSGVRAIPNALCCEDHLTGMSNIHVCALHEYLLLVAIIIFMHLLNYCGGVHLLIIIKFWTTFFPSHKFMGLS